MVVSTINTEPSLTQQQYKDECDVNNIMKKYKATGLVSHLNKKIGKYADMSSVKDYQTMLDTVIEAQQAFDSLDAELRYRFRNDPGELISFLADEKNYEEALKLGLVNEKAPPSPPKNATVSDATTGGSSGGTSVDVPKK